MPTATFTAYQEIIEQAPDAILCTDAAGLVNLWNRGAERIFGFNAAEALGQSLDLIIPERQRERHWEGFHNTMRSGETKYGTKLLAVPALHKDGTRLSVEFSIVMLRSADGHPSGVAAIMRDVTERNRQDKTLREKLAEFEGRQSVIA